MRDVVLIGCTKRKRDELSPARELYQESPLYRKRLAYAESLDPDLMLVLSAKHHVLKMDEEIEPYDVTLNEMSRDEGRDWASRVLDQLRNLTDPEHDRFIFLAGRSYYRDLLSHLEHHEIPTDGMPIGETLRYLDEAAGDNAASGCSPSKE